MGLILEIDNLWASIDGKQILKGVNLRIGSGEVHALMGRNGSGKSTLAHVLMGHPKYVVDSGRISFMGEDLLSISTAERARKGMFLAFQYPMSIPGVSVANFLRSSMNAVQGGRTDKISLPVSKFRKELKEKMNLLKIDPSFAKRYLNEGFSGGEKKRVEVLQMAMLKPHLALLDETDSGLDIDALKIVSDGVNVMKAENAAMLIITHYQRILDYIVPGHVHVMGEGRIIASGGPDLARKLEAEGYEWLNREGVSADVD